MGLVVATINGRESAEDRRPVTPKEVWAAIRDLVSRHYVFAIIGGADTFDSRVTRSMFLCDVLGLTATFAYSPAFAVHHPLRNAPAIETRGMPRWHFPL